MRQLKAPMAEVGTEPCSDRWVSRTGPGGRTFWHHTALGPAPWEQPVRDLAAHKSEEDKGSLAFARSLMGRVDRLREAEEQASRQHRKHAQSCHRSSEIE